MYKTLQLVALMMAALVCLSVAMPAPDHYGGGGGGGGGGYGGGGHGHGKATSYQSYVLHSYHPVKVHVGGHGHDGGGYGGHY